MQHHLLLILDPYFSVGDRSSLLPSPFLLHCYPHFILKMCGEKTEMTSRKNDITPAYSKPSLVNVAIVIKEKIDCNLHGCL